MISEVIKLEALSSTRIDSSLDEELLMDFSDKSSRALRIEESFHEVRRMYWLGERDEKAERKVPARCLSHIVTEANSPLLERGAHFGASIIPWKGENILSGPRERGESGEYQEQISANRFLLFNKAMRHLFMFMPRSVGLVGARGKCEA